MQSEAVPDRQQPFDTSTATRWESFSPPPALSSASLEEERRCLKSNLGRAPLRCGKLHRFRHFQIESGYEHPQSCDETRVHSCNRPQSQWQKLADTVWWRQASATYSTSCVWPIFKEDRKNWRSWVLFGSPPTQFTDPTSLTITNFVLQGIPTEEIFHQS